MRTGMNVPHLITFLSYRVTAKNAVFFASEALEHMLISVQRRGNELCINRVHSRVGQMRVAMLTYSTRPRGGVVHALKLAERLRSLGVDVTLYSLAKSDDPGAARGYFRKVSVPYEIFSYDWSLELVTRLERMIEAYSAHLPRDCDIYHAQA